MLDTILDAQADIKGGAPSYILNVDDFNRMNDLLLSLGYISAPLEYEKFMGN